MKSAATIRIQIESALSNRVPSALTPVPRIIRPVAPTGICAIDELLAGGLPTGAITEVVGPECSGRTSVALSFASRLTGEGKVCAWIDVSDVFHAESAAAAGVCLSRLLWIRCGLGPSSSTESHQRLVAVPKECFIAPTPKKGLHGGAFGPHPRTEVKGLSEAVDGLFGDRAFPHQRLEPRPKERTQKKAIKAPAVNRASGVRRVRSKALSRIDQALRVADLLLQAGGFSAIVLDFGSMAPEHATRVQAATWFRYRAAAERTQASILLLTQHKCAQSSAELVLRMKPGEPIDVERTVFCGIRHQVEIVRERSLAPATNAIPLRKPPQSDRQAAWQNRTSWAGRR